MKRSWVIGGGVVGVNAAQMAVGMGANVTILDRNAEVLERLGGDVVRMRVRQASGGRAA